MPQCRSIRCGRWAHDDWACCAFCGEPLWGQPQPDEALCDHYFVLEGRYCVLCGYDPEVGGRLARATLLAYGGLVLAVGFGLAAVSFRIMVDPPPRQIGESTRGPSWLGLVMVGGLILVWFGVSKILKALRLSD